MIIHWFGSAAKTILDAHIHVWDKSLTHMLIEGEEFEALYDAGCIDHLIFVVNGTGSYAEVAHIEERLHNTAPDIKVDRYFDSESALSAPHENVASLLKFGFRPFHQKYILDLYLKGNHLSFLIEQSSAISPTFPILFRNSLERSLHFFHNKLSLTECTAYSSNERISIFKNTLLDKQIFPEDLDILSLSCYAGGHRVEILAPSLVIHEHNQLLYITLNQLGADKTVHTSSLGHLSKSDIIDVFDLKTCRVLLFSIKDTQTLSSTYFLVLFENR